MLNLIDGIGKSTAADILQQINPRRPTKSLVNCTVPKAAESGWRELRQLFRTRDRLKNAWPDEVGAIIAWYKPYLLKNFDDAEDRLSELAQFADLAAGFGSRQQLLVELALEPPEMTGEVGRSKQADDDILTLSTIHSAKGHEWRSVVLLNAVEGCLPSSRITGQEELEEERRLLYVAITRPKDRLEVMMPRRVFLAWQKARGGNLHLRPTRFLPESLRSHFKHS